ncbi:MAG: permease-like cell division protein FtsX [Myxococcales bacterium]|nr:permease-like cell division protein FtsX [Myxococcales bacterium]
MSFARSTLHRVLAGARDKPLIQLVAVGTIALSLLLVGAVELTALNVRQLSRGWGGDVQMTVYLEDGVTAARAQKVAAALGKLPGVAAVRTVDAHEAWTRLRRSLGARADLLDGVEDGFLPSSIEVALKPGVAEVLRAHPAFERLRHTAGVEDVELMGSWASRLRDLEHLLSVASWAVAALVLCACLYIVGSTIRLGVFARRDEIEIWKLVGATNAFVKAPFLVEGGLQGALGTGLAVALLYALYRLASPRVELLLGGWLASGPLGFFTPLQLAVAIAAGALLGLCGSALALGRYVKV